MNLKPLGDRVVIQVKEEEEKMIGGILLPGSAKEKPQEGVIAAVGDGAWFEGKRLPMDVKVGDKVIYSKYAGSEIKIDDEEYLICRQDDLLAIVE
ncbi:MAG: co-chaperone GroES [Bacilli bacterium]|jgi:chaperonin GroES